MSWWWVRCVAGAAGVAILAGLRWALADLLLDQFGSLPDSLTRVEPSEVERPASDRSESLRSPFQIPDE